MALNWLPEPYIVVRLLAMLCGLAVFALAVQGYRRNGSASLLSLGAGVLTLTVLDTVTIAALAAFAGPRAYAIAARLVTLLGLVLILVAMVRARRA